MNFLSKISKKSKLFNNSSIKKHITLIKERVESIACILCSALITYFLLLIPPYFPTIHAIVVPIGTVIGFIAIIPMLYLICIVPILENYRKKTNAVLSRVIRKRIKQYYALFGILLAFNMGYIGIRFLHISTAWFIVYNACVLSAISVVYQFLYKPARAGKLPRWVQRVLGRGNSIVQLRDDITALADSHETRTDASDHTTISKTSV